MVDIKYSGDNGTMIAWNGLLAHGSGQKTSLVNSKVKQKWKTDEVDVLWIK